MTDNGLTVRQAATETGVGEHTLRYYEQIGLILPVPRTVNGHRRYSESDIRWIHFLKRLRATGMPIARMRQYVALAQAGDSTIRQRRELLQDHYDHVCTRIEELATCLSIIENKIQWYAETDQRKRTQTTKASRKENNHAAP